LFLPALTFGKGLLRRKQGRRGKEEEAGSQHKKRVLEITFEVIELN